MNIIFQTPFSFSSLPTGASEREGLHLFPGRLVNVRVESIKPDGTVILKLGSNILEAYTNVTLQPDQEVTLEVQGQVEGKWYLKVLNPTAQANSSQDIGDLLESMGLPKSESMKTIAVRLLEFGLPVSRQNIVEVQRSLGILGGMQEDNLRLAIFSQRAGLTQSTEALQLLKAFLGQSGKIEPQLTVLLNLLETGLEAAGTKSSHDLTLLSNVVRSSFLSQQVTPSASGQIVNGLTMTEMSTGGISGSVSEPAEILDIKIMVNTLKQILAIMLPREGNHIEVISQYLRDWPTNSTLLADFLEIVDQAILKSEASSRQWPESFRLTIHKLIQSITSELYGQQVLHTVDKSLIDRPNYYYFAWPLPFIEENAKGELRIYKREGKQKKLNIDNLRVVFCLETPHLGKNLFDLHFYHRELRFRVQVQQEEIGQMIVKYWPELAERLQLLGFRTHLQECRVGKPTSLRPEPEPLVDLQQVPRID